MKLKLGVSTRTLFWPETPKTPWTEEAAWGARGGATGLAAATGATGAAGAGWREDRVVETVCWMKGVSWEMILATCTEIIYVLVRFY